MEEPSPSSFAPATQPGRASCPNCDAEISGPYCATCGQLQSNLNRQIWSLADDLLDDLFRLDSRIARTLFALLFRPGFLTTEFFAGRRARYTPPVRLYLVISFAFFFLVPMFTDIGNQPIGTDGANISEDGGQVVIEQDTEDPEVSFNGIDLPWLDEEENAAFEARMEQQVLKAKAQLEEDPSVLFSALMDQMSAVMFFMLPIFAIFLKIMYVGSGVYYAEHLLLAVHNHCFLFIALLLSGVLSTVSFGSATVVTDTLDDLINIWIVIYMYLSMKTAYGQGHFVTLLKFIFLGLVYLVLTLTGLIVASLVGLMAL